MKKNKQKIFINVDGYGYELIRPMRRHRSITIRFAGKDYYVKYNKVKGCIQIELDYIFLGLL